MSTDIVDQLDDVAIPRVGVRDVEPTAGRHRTTDRNADVGSERGLLAGERPTDAPVGARHALICASCEQPLPDADNGTSARAAADDAPSLAGSQLVSETQSATDAVALDGIGSPTDPWQAAPDSIVATYVPIGDIAADPAGSMVALTNCVDNELLIIDAEDPAADCLIALDGEPLAAAIAAGHVFVATTSASHDSVWVLDLDTKAVVSEHPLTHNITSLAVSQDGERVFAARTGPHGNDIAIIDTPTGEEITLEIATDAGEIIDAMRIGANGLLYAGISGLCHGDLIVVDVDRAHVIATVRIGAPVRDVALSPDGAAAYVLACDPRGAGAGAVFRIDTASNTIGAIVEVAESATRLAVSPDGTRAYVVEHDGLAEMCMLTGEVIDRITFGAQPSCVAAGLGAIFVGDYDGVVTGFVTAAPTAGAEPSGTVIAMTPPAAEPPIAELEAEAV